MEHSVSYANSWLVAVDGARRRIPGSVAVLVAIAALTASLLGGVAVYRALPDFTTLLGGGETGRAVDRLALYVCTVGLLYVVALIGLGLERRGGIVGRRGGLGLTVGFSVGVLGFAVAVIISGLLGAVRIGGDSSPLAHRILGATIAAGLVLFQASGEELFFRGWLQPLLGARWGPWIGLGVTSCLFGAAHAVSGPIGVLAVLNDILAGAVFGLVALRSGGLAAPILAHWGWNWTEMALLGLTPNPGVDPLGSLFDLDLVGPRLLTGGADEMNGSVVATLVLFSLLLLTSLWRSRLKR